MWILLFTFLSSQLGFSQVSFSPVDIHLENLHQGPSCRLLKHREREREKRIRQWFYIIEESEALPSTELSVLNQFSYYRLFFDTKQWEKDLVRVHIVFWVPSEFESELQYSHFDDLFLSLEAPGLLWRGPSFNFPEHVDWQIKDDGLHLTYTMFRSHLCHSPTFEPDLKWYPDPSVIMTSS